MGIGGWISDRYEDAKDAVDDAADEVEQAWDDGTEWLGEQIDAGSEHVADAMDHVGWESGADWVRDRGDDAADFLGAEVDEMELGESEDPKDLVHGEVERISELSTRLSTFSGHMADAGSGLAGISAGTWDGSASDGFDARLRAQPPKWDAASSACSSASTAVSDFASAVTRAQDRAQVAIDTWKQAERDSRDAVTAYNARVDDYNAKRHLPEAERPERPGSFVDPGDAGRARAREILDDARRNRDEAGETAASTVRAATSEAPEEPEFTEELAGGLSDLHQMGQVWDAHLTMGALKGVTGLVALVRTVNPTDPYNIRNPAAYLENVSNLANGLVHTLNDPLGTLGTMFSKFGTDPAEALGELIPELLGAKGLGRVGRLDDVLPPGGRHPDGPDGLPVPPRQLGRDGLWEHVGDERRTLAEQMQDPSYSPAVRDLIEDDYDYLGGEQSVEDFLDRYQRTDPRTGERGWDWPPPGEEAVAGTTRRVPLDEVPALDRIGGGDGTYFGREGDPFGSRALPPDRLNFPHNNWSVDVDHPDLRSGAVYLRESEVAPAFGQPGGGMQYEFVRVGEDGTETVLNQDQLDHAGLIERAGASTR